MTVDEAMTAARKLRRSYPSRGFLLAAAIGTAIVLQALARLRA